MSWERVLRMLGLQKEPLPDTREDPRLDRARAEVEQLHIKSEQVLQDYAEQSEAAKNGEH